MHAAVLRATLRWLIITSSHYERADCARDLIVARARISLRLLSSFARGRASFGQCAEFKSACLDGGGDDDDEAARSARPLISAPSRASPEVLCCCVAPASARARESVDDDDDGRSTGSKWTHLASGARVFTSPSALTSDLFNLIDRIAHARTDKLNQRELRAASPVSRAASSQSQFESDSICACRRRRARAHAHAHKLSLLAALIRDALLAAVYFIVCVRRHKVAAATCKHTTRALNCCPIGCDSYRQHRQQQRRRRQSGYCIIDTIHLLAIQIECTGSAVASSRSRKLDETLQVAASV